MATRTFTSNAGNNRMTISTILTHTPFYHEAGLEITTELRVRLRYVWWNPSTWFGYRWDRSDAVNQPSISDYQFIQGADILRNPNDFAVAVNRSVGYSKSFCIYAHRGDGEVFDIGNDARSVNNITVTFTYNGRKITLRHSDN